MIWSSSVSAADPPPPWLVSVDVAFMYKVLRSGSSQRSVSKHAFLPAGPSASEATSCKLKLLVSVCRDEQEPEPRIRLALWEPNGSWLSSEGLAGLHSVFHSAPHPLFKPPEGLGDCTYAGSLNRAVGSNPTSDTICDRVLLSSEEIN